MYGEHGPEIHTQGLPSNAGKIGTPHIRQPRPCARTRQWRRGNHEQLVEAQGTRCAGRHKSLGARLLFIPAYRADLILIEQAFAKPKAKPRRAAGRTIYSHWNAIGHIVDL